MQIVPIGPYLPSAGATSNEITSASESSSRPRRECVRRYLAHAAAVEYVEQERGGSERARTAFKESRCVSCLYGFVMGAHVSQRA
jgi:hypothetical protein